MSEDIRRMINKVKNFKESITEGEINWDKEKSWEIKDQFPITVFVEKTWTGRYYIIKAPSMKISYETWEDLASFNKVGMSSYDYENGEAIWMSNSLDDIKEWADKNSDKIIVDYSKLK
jgi:hypothetical protein